jgi:hypothetical protein
MADINHTGYKDMILTDEQFAEIYMNKRLSGVEFFENEYLIARKT